MNNIFSLLLLCAVAATPFDSLPPRKDDASRASKNGKLTGEVAGAKFVVAYGRPKVKGRAVWKELVTPGEVWRAGSDEATVVAFDKDVLVEGQKLPAGAYAFMVIPGKDPAKDAWTLIFNKNAKQWGSYSYDAKEDALRVTASPKAAAMTEELSFKQDGSAIVFQWEKIAVSMQIKKAG
jgi:hypothetical protein